MKTKFLFLFFLFIAARFIALAQDKDSIAVHDIYVSSLRSYTGYNLLRQLCKEAPERLTGSDNSFKAVKLITDALNKMKFDTVYQQPLLVNRWQRDKAEKASIIIPGKQNIPIHICSQGFSVATPCEGIQASVIEVRDFEELNSIGMAHIKDKIVFINHVMDNATFDPASEYEESSQYRTQGAINAARYGAIGVVVRSLTNNVDTFPFTGIMRYSDTLTQIPSFSIATADADRLSNLLKDNPTLLVTYTSKSIRLSDTISYNVIAEIRGTEKTNEIIIVGGHIDSWDIGEGANDDGSGCINAIEVLRVFRELGIKPKRTVRLVLFMDEEANQKGAKAYAKWQETQPEKVYFAFESDQGGGVPTGFGCTARNQAYTNFRNLEKYFKHYNIYQYAHGGVETDIYFLGVQKVIMMSLFADNQNYFSFHHCINDRFESINHRHLALGGASMASMIYLIDKNNLFNLDK